MKTRHAYIFALVLFSTLTIFILYQYMCMHLQRSKEAFTSMMLHPNEFDVYLINLSKNKDRFQHFVSLYTASDLNFKSFYRLEAVDGKTLKISEYVSDYAMDEINFAETNGHRTKHYQLSRGGVGCYLSHMMVYRRIAEGKKPYGIIFEDDVIIEKDIYAKIHDFLQNIPTDWDIVLFGCHCIKCNKETHYNNVKRFFWLHGYLLSQTGAKKIIKYLNDIPIEQQIDAVLSDMAEKNKIRIYCMRNAAAKQNNGFHTTIQVPLKKVDGIDPYSSLDVMYHKASTNTVTKSAASTDAVVLSTRS